MPQCAYDAGWRWGLEAGSFGFLELNLTLAQLRTLYLVTASGPMSRRRTGSSSAPRAAGRTARLTAG